jgi:hypothetical protein
MSNAGGKPVYQNEFEYRLWASMKKDAYFMNIGQALMNWMVFENSPTWFWLHASKPVTNKENLQPGLKPGYWEYNPYNWNALAGFVR